MIDIIMLTALISLIMVIVLILHASSRDKDEPTVVLFTCLVTLLVVLPMKLQEKITIYNKQQEKLEARSEENE